MNTVSTQVTKWTGKTLSTFMLTLVAFLITTGFVNAQSYSGPIVITKGGTYTGNWESRDSEVAAVEVRTSEPVTIVNSNIRGAGYLIKSWGTSANITVRHTNGYGLAPTPWRDYKKPRRFLTVNNFKNVIVENCYMEQTAGIYIGTRYEGDGSTNNTVKIRYNRAKNIDGRVHGSAEHSQFTQFNFRGNLPHAEIAWNEVINEPNNSLVEDNINMHNSRGTSSSPIRIHNNYIQGAYPVNANGTSYSGGGIITDGDGDINSCPSFIHANDNHLVNLGNYSMGIAGGNNIRYTQNRAVNSATFDNGTRFSMYTSGLWSKDYYKKNTTFNNSVDNNTVGIMAWGWTNDRNDINVQEATSFTNNTSIPGIITKQMEKDEYTRWLQKLQQNNVKLGPNGSAPSTSPTPTQPVNEAPVATAPADQTPSTGSGSTSTGATSGVVGTGKITREVWRNVHGTTLSVIPVNTTPAVNTTATTFEAPSGQGNNYGQRMRGYVTAPVSGQYTFWIAADDVAELYLSTSEDPNRKTRIALASTWTNAREWNKTSGQQSAKITLEAGKRYYIEALMLQGGGGDNLAVGWQLPNGTMERPIAGNRLSEMGSTAPVVSAPVATAPVGKITRDLWTNIHGNNLGVVPVNTKPNSTSELTVFEAPSGQGNNYGQRIRGYVTAPTSGEYTFWIAADDMADLYLSTSEDPARKTRIAFSASWTNPREWTKNSSQQSAKITLEAGKRYYIEAVMLQGGGGDNLAVGWQLPNGTMERPIAGNRLSPMELLSASSTSALQADTNDSDISFDKVAAYPNPFSDVVTLDLGQEEIKLQEVVILDQAGTVVYKEESLKVENNKLVMNLAATGLRPGLYFLKYTTSNGKSATIKLIKE